METDGGVEAGGDVEKGDGTGEADAWPGGQSALPVGVKDLRGVKPGGRSRLTGTGGLETDEGGLL